MNINPCTWFTTLTTLWLTLNNTLMIAAMEMASSLQVQPFVRIIVDYMDNAGGTNKSQYVFGGFGLRVAAGDFDAIYPSYMVAGHTKFDSDTVLQHLGNAYNRSDVFNHGMLNSVYSPYATIHAYDGNLLTLHKEATTMVFQPVTNIQSYRCFAIIADDGHLDDDLKQTSKTDVNFPDEGPMFTDESLQTAVANLAERSLKKIIPVALSGRSYAGLGEGTGLYGLPSKNPVLPSRTGRLFKKMTEKGKVWLEQPFWHKRHARNSASIEKALSVAKPLEFTSCTIEWDGSAYKPYYGVKAEQIQLQYEQWVPIQYTPDEYSITSRGAAHSQLVLDLLLSSKDEAEVRISQELLLMEKEDLFSSEVRKMMNAPDVPNCISGPVKRSRTPLSGLSESDANLHSGTSHKKSRYSFKTHDTQLLRLCNGKYPTKNQIAEYATTMNFTSKQIRDALKRLSDKGQLLAK